MSIPDVNFKDLDKALRPNSWQEYIGQEKIKKNLEILLKAARQRNQAPDHILFYGAPGLGKTSLAYVIAKEYGSQLKITSGPALERASDLASVLSNLQDGDILFIDEIHRLNKNIEELIYPAMESGVLDIVIGKGASARVLQLELSDFTIIAATTQLAKISSPLRSRFSGGVLKLEFYSDEEIVEILKISAEKLNIENIKDKTLLKIAKASRKTPRIANYILKRFRDYCQVHSSGFNEESVDRTLQILEISKNGLNKEDREYLSALYYKFSGGPAGLKSISATIAEEESTIENVIEPYLLQEAYIERTNKGRIITEKGKSVLEDE